MNYLNILLESQKQYNSSFNQRFLVELCLMQLCSIDNSTKKKNIIDPPKKFDLKKKSEETASIKNIKEVDEVDVLDVKISEDNSNISEQKKITEINNKIDQKIFRRINTSK